MIFNVFNDLQWCSLSQLIEGVYSHCDWVLSTIDFQLLCNDYTGIILWRLFHVVIISGVEHPRGIALPPPPSPRVRTEWDGRDDDASECEQEWDGRDDDDFDLAFFEM